MTIEEAKDYVLSELAEAGFGHETPQKEGETWLIRVLSPDNTPVGLVGFVERDAFEANAEAVLRSKVLEAVAAARQEPSMRAHNGA